MTLRWSDAMIPSNKPIAGLAFKPSTRTLSLAAAGVLSLLAACRGPESEEGKHSPPPAACKGGFGISDTEISYNLAFLTGHVVTASSRAVSIITSHGGRLLSDPESFRQDEASLQAIVPSTAAQTILRGLTAGRIVSYHEQRRNHPDDLWCLEDRMERARQLRLFRKSLPSGPLEPDFETMLKWKQDLEAAPGRAHLQIIIYGPRSQTHMSEALAEGRMPLRTPGVDRWYMLSLEAADAVAAMRRAESILFTHGAIRSDRDDRFRGRGGRKLYTAKFLMPGVEAERSLPHLRALGNVDQFDLNYLRDPLTLAEIDRRIALTPSGKARDALVRRRAFHAKGSGWVELRLSMYSLGKHSFEEGVEYIRKRNDIGRKASG